MDKIIVMFDNKDEIVPMSLYEFIDIEYKSFLPFVVCNVSEEDFIEIEKQAKTGYLQERLPRLDLNRKPYASNRYMMGYNRDLKEIILVNPDDPNTGRFSIVDGHIKYNKDELALSNDDMQQVFSKSTKIYTTEKFNDVLNHYLLTNIEAIDPTTMNKEEVNMYLNALNKRLRKLQKAYYMLYNKKEEIRLSEETPAEKFIKYSK